jgi:hypothetical protein
MSRFVTCEGGCCNYLLDYPQSVQAVRLIDLFEMLLDRGAQGFAGDVEEGLDGCYIELVQVSDLQELSQRPLNSSTAPTDEAVLEILKAFRMATPRSKRQRAIP